MMMMKKSSNALQATSDPDIAAFARCALDEFEDSGPVDVDYRTITVAALDLDRARAHHRLPFLLCHLESPNAEAARERHLALRLVVLPSDLALGCTHDEGTLRKAAKLHPGDRLGPDITCAVRQAAVQGRGSSDLISRVTTGGYCHQRANYQQAGDGSTPSRSHDRTQKRIFDPVAASSAAGSEMCMAWMASGCVTRTKPVIEPSAVKCR